MSKTRLIYVVGANNYDEGIHSNFIPCHGYSNWTENTGFVKNIEDSDLVLGLGGSDVCSSYYNQPNSGFLGSNPSTDKKEYADYKQAIKLKKPILGICKGSQWGAALAGGAIFQHVTHPHWHKITTHDGKELIVNSLHHNMQDVSNLKEGEDYKLLAWAENLSDVHYNGYKENVTCLKESEVVYYPKINFLGIQCHPEMFYGEKDAELVETITYFRKLLTNLLNQKL